jgi:type IV pilus assembly protein PilA
VGVGRTPSLPDDLTVLTRRVYDDAFTLIELLVVVLIIGLLSAIAIPIFVAQQENAKDAQAISDLGLAQHALQLWSTANDGGFTSDLDELASYGYAGSDPVTGTSIDIIDATARTYCIEATSSTGNVYSVRAGSGIERAACS